MTSISNSITKKSQLCLIFLVSQLPELGWGVPKS